MQRGQAAFGNASLTLAQSGLELLTSHDLGGSQLGLSVLLVGHVQLLAVGRGGACLGLHAQLLVDPLEDGFVLGHEQNVGNVPEHQS